MQGSLHKWAWSQNARSSHPNLDLFGASRRLSQATSFTGFEPPARQPPIISLKSRCLTPKHWRCDSGSRTVRC